MELDGVEVFSASDLSEFLGKGFVDKAENIEENVENEQKETPEVTDGKPQESGSEEGEVEVKTPDDKAGVSPNKYSSIATALKEEGVLPDLTDEEIAKIVDSSSLRDAFISQTDKRLNNQQKRVIDALNYGVEPTEIQKYEQTLGFLFNIKEEDITSEDKKGEELRKQLIFNDFVNRGFSKERANKEVEKSLNAGTDINDAKEALESQKAYWHQGYEKLREDAKKADEEFKANRLKGLEDLKKTIDGKENAFGSLALTKEMKDKIYDAVVKPVYKDEDGEYMTALQKYEREHHYDFLRYVGALFAMSDGFTDFSKIFKPVAQKAVKSGFDKLDDVLKGNTNPKDGNLKLMGDSGKGEYFSGNWKIDLE